MEPLSVCLMLANIFLLCIQSVSHIDPNSVSSHLLHTIQMNFSLLAASQNGIMDDIYGTELPTASSLWTQRQRE